MPLCIAAAGKSLTIATAAFTLSWTHSVQKIRWEEDWTVSSAGLQVVEARVQGSGAGLDPPPDATFRDQALASDWRDELETMRRRMVALREGFAEALRRQSNSDRFDFLARHRGMFSRLGITPQEVEALRQKHGVYIVGDGRINVAGLPGDRLDDLGAAVVSVVGKR